MVVSKMETSAHKLLKIMETIKVKIERTYKFVKGKDCDNCDLYDLCNEVNWNDCQEGTAGHYEIDDEQIEQL